MASLRKEAHRPVAAIYARVSTAKQQTIPEQVRSCRARADQLGARVGFVLEEQAASARDLCRPKIPRLLELAETGRINLIVVWKLDRLVRSLRDLVNVNQRLESCGVRLHSVTEQFDTSSSFGRFNFRNIASAAELERDLIAERARLGKLGQAIAGRWPTQTPPFGYDLGPQRTLAPNAGEGALVREIFDWYADDVPLTEITRRLGDRGAVSRRGRTFSPSAVHAMLTNPIYEGRLRILDKEHARPDLRLVPQATARKVAARRGRRVRDGGAATRRAAAIDAVFADYLAGLAETDEAATEA